MAKDRKGLQLLDGFGHSFFDSLGARAKGCSESRHEECAHFPILKPSQEELVSALQAMEQRLNALLEDRGRLGRDLHDGILQSLYAIGLNMETARREHRPSTPEHEQTHVHTITQINRLIHDIRQMIRELDEGVVQEFNLMTELQALKAVYDQINHMRITLDLHPAAIEVLTKEEEREIMNIVREALSNCVRHARAAHAKIAIRKRGEKILLTIRDDGTGFATAAGSVKRGYGLANMEARARKIGGTLRVRSEPGHGTDITAEFSLEPILVPV